MKKVLLIVMAMVAALVVTSCSEEVLTGSSQESAVNVTYTINTQSRPGSRATHDADGEAAKVNRYICEVWHVDGATSTLYKRVVNVVAEGTKNTTFNLRLLESQNYQVLFWADHATVDGAGEVGANGAAATDLYYVTANGLKEVTIKAPYTGNNDEMDAFYGKCEINNLKAAFAENVTLSRPFAQLNVISTDVNQIKSSQMAETLNPDKVKLTVNAPTKFNVWDGSISESKDIAYTADVYYLTSQKNKKPGTDAEYTYCTLAMSYILAPANEKAIETVKLVALNGEKTITESEYANIPLQRNYRTNIIGNLLTNDATFTVNVDAIWAASENDVIWTKVSTVNDVASAFADGTTNNVEVINAPTEDATIKIPKIFEANNETSLGIKIPASDKTITFEYDESEQNAPANVNIVADNTAGQVEINCPNSHVTLNGQYYDVSAATSSSTLVVEKGVTVSGKLTVTEGGVEIHGTVASLEVLPAQGKTVVFRACEGLANGVYEVAKEYLAPGYAGKQNADGTWDIYKYVAAKIKDVEYVTLNAAFNAAKSGDVIELCEDFENTGAMTMKAGVTLDGMGHTFKGQSSVYINSTIGGTVRNVKFIGIHNESNKQSAVLCENFTGNTVVENCEFVNCDWDAIQFIPCAGSNVVIKDNHFACNNGLQQRFIHIQSAVNVDFSAKVTGNVMQGSTVQGALECYYFADPSKVDLTKNYCEDRSGNCILKGNGTIANELQYPAWADPEKTIELSPVAMIKLNAYLSKEFTSLNDAFAAVAANQTIDMLKAGTYTIPGSGIGSVPAGVKVNGKEGVVFDCTGGGSIANITNGITFNDITFKMGDAEYHGFQHSGKITYNNCVINGYYKTYGETKFSNCTFNQETYTYCLNAYGTNLDIEDCTFNNKGKCFYVYNEGNPAEFVVNVKNCTFNVVYGAKAKPQVFVKNNYGGQKYVVNISGCTINADKTLEEYKALDIDPDLTNGKGDLRIWNVEEGASKGDKVVVTLENETVYSWIKPAE